MTTAEVAMLLIGAAGSLGTIAAVILSNRDTKRTMAVAWGQMLERVSSHGERLTKAEEKLEKHETRISTIEGGKANGKYVGPN